MNTLIEKLLEKAVGHYAAHNHNWSDSETTTLVVVQEVGSTRTVHTKKVMASYCSECSAIRYNNDVFVKVGEPNLYSTP